MVSMQNLNSIRKAIQKYNLADEASVVRELVSYAGLSDDTRREISLSAASLVEEIRTKTNPGLMESFLAEYGLSTKEGVALMCMAEALLRVPDAETIDALIEDKISTGGWVSHKGKSGSSLVNASTWALMLTGKVLTVGEEKKILSQVKGMIKTMGEPIVRKAVSQAMRELGRQFVLGRDIKEATTRAAGMEAKGFSYSYDMLGEAARTEADAKRYHLSYSDAITALAGCCKSDDIRLNPGISVKLSALHARYEYGQRDRVMSELVARARSLALLAKSANMGFNIDAEEADRLDLSLDVIQAIIEDPALANWDGFGVVVQAFGKRAPYVLDWLYALSKKLDRKIMVRLVKGAYWDTEVKRAQVLGLEGFPVFTRKINTDISYIACAKKLLTMTDRIYPQFATHNAHSVAAILEMATDKSSFEFQRLHGMGENLHNSVLKLHGTKCRIYAPVGAHKDLLAYLVRRLLENGANSSFVNQIVDPKISPMEIAKDPFDAILELGENIENKMIAKPAQIFGAGRINAKGWDITCTRTIDEINKARAAFKTHVWTAAPMIDGEVDGGASIQKYNPAKPDDLVGEVTQASLKDVDVAIDAAVIGFKKWSKTSAGVRADYLRKLADLYERDADEMFALTAREAGKILLDGVGEIREAVDFIRFYANEAERLGNEGQARGLITCISPWNFPLAIFTGQLIAALAAGNVVLVKPAEQTALIAAKAVRLMYEAGIPKSAIQLLPGRGSVIGDALTKDPRIAGVCFTGSTPTAQRINKVMAENLNPNAPLIAETGGLNAMIVDSTALPEQAVRDILASAFQSAGQRCSALRILYIQKDVAERTLKMLKGAMGELKIGNPWDLSTDIGPVIDELAKEKIENHIAEFEAKGQLIKRLDVPSDGLFVAPTVLSVSGIEELAEEIFGPVLHVATFEAREIDAVVDAINAKEFGLTFGLHTRVDARAGRVAGRIKVGNIYVNRNQIGAVVGSQPFGGEGLSGTGPKAGGPQYVARFKQHKNKEGLKPDVAKPLNFDSLQREINQLSLKSWVARVDRLTLLEGQLADNPDLLAKITQVAKAPEELPGPTGELNQLSIHPRGVVLCLGPSQEDLKCQALQALAMGNGAVVVGPETPSFVDHLQKLGAPVVGLEGGLLVDQLAEVKGISAVVSFADDRTLKSYRVVLAGRDGMLLPLITEIVAPEYYIIERHLCVDTTAAGGNASLLAVSS